MVGLEEAKVNEKGILLNFIEKYLYELSQYDNSDINKDGLFGYKYIDSYWMEEGRYPYFITFENEKVGFVLVNKYSEYFKDVDYSIAEFFILYKYRKYGIAKESLRLLFDKHNGFWEIKIHPNNKTAISFWKKNLERYSTIYNIEKGSNINKFNDGSVGLFIRRSNKYQELKNMFLQNQLFYDNECAGCF